MSQTMITPDPTDTASPIQAPTVCEAFQRLVAQKPGATALRSQNGAESLTWAELDARVRGIAGGLAALGIGHGDTVAMLLPNVMACHIVDYAAIHLGAVPFTIYNSSTAEQIAFQLGHADATLIVTDSAMLPKVLEAQANAPGLQHVVVTDGDGGTTTLADLEQGGADDFDFDAAWRAVDAEDLVTMIFTSGTTGPPKGAQWAHRTVMSQIRALDAALPMPTEGVISFLPMAHAGGRITSHYVPLAYGAAITTCPDMKELPAFLAEVHPDVLFAVPRLWEKLQVGIEGLVATLPDEDERRACEAAIAVGLERVKAMDAGADADPARAAELEQAHSDGIATLKPVLARLGLDRIKSAFVGGAPSAPELSAFFRAVGVPLLEAYGLTEGSLNIFSRPEDFKGGTAGKPLPGVELRLAEDGEMLIRSDLNFVSYRKQEDVTRETLDADGWLHTGDIAEVDADGYVKVVDRKKEIIISAAGKNMSPANIEQAIKGESSLIGQVVTIGDGRRYNTALITLDPEAAPTYAKRLGVAPGSFDELVRSPELHAEVAAAVERGNARLMRVEQIKKFTLLPVFWMPDSDEMTPTMKLKRKPIAAKYSAEIEALYAE
jgi:long-subunit acyl-CoA synthetase (AMP-forming)